MKQKNQTLKIDIRSLGTIRNSAIHLENKNAVLPSDYATALDPHFLFDSSYDAILLTTATGTIIQANARAEELFHYSCDEFKAMQISDLIAGMSASVLNDINTHLTTSRHVRIQAFCIRKAGDSTPVEAIVRTNTAGDMPVVIYQIRDVKASWNAEQNLISAYHAMNNTDSGIGIVTEQGIVTYANQAMIALLGGTKPEDVIGQNLIAWFDYRSFIQPMQAAIRARTQWTGEQGILHGESSRWLAVSAVPDVNEDGALNGMVISMRDLADKHRAEVAESKVARDRVMVESLAGICHALGQPATVLMSSIEFLKMGMLGAEEQKEIVALCYDAVVELRELLQKLSQKRQYIAESYLPKSEPADDAILSLEK